MSNINNIVLESYNRDEFFQEVGILRGLGRGLAQGAAGTVASMAPGVGSLASGGAAAGTTAGIHQMRDRLAELRGEKPKGAGVGRGLATAGAGLLGAIPLVGGAVNAIQGFRAGRLKSQLNQANAQAVQQAKPSTFG